MAMFVLVTKLNDSLIATANQRKTAGSHWLKKVKELCPDVRWKAHYALLGRYDFMDIYEADDIETAQKVAVLTRSLGAKEVESWQATPYDAFLGVLEEVNDALSEVR